VSGPGVPFDVFTSILVVAVVVAGGVGSPVGALFGALLISGGIVSKIFSGVSSINEYLPLAGGILLILTLIFSPDGIFEANRRMVAMAAARFAKGRWARTPRLSLRPTPRPADVGSEPVAISVEPLILQVDDLSVTFGGVKALSGVSLEVRPGEVHGIIGPNGAGKTTLIDAITGFVSASGGAVRIGHQDVLGWSARRLASAGISRSFQSLELFDDLTVEENLAVASNRDGIARFVTDLVHPGQVHLSAAAVETVRQFELTELAGRKPREISFGQRKTVAIARAVAGAPSVLLLDEPAAGLDDHEASELAQLIRRLADNWGIGVLLVEHKIDLIMSTSDRVTVLANGRILRSGTPSEVGNDPEVHTAYLGTPDVDSGGPALSIVAS
jgi:ABC-type branched-subunit amino acid transport system ATPase component